MRLVLLHSLPFDGSIWDGCTPLGYDEVVAPTLYDLGDSVEEWAANLLDTIGGAPFVVAGHAIGGSCALELARLAPTSVSALVLIGAEAAQRPEPELAASALRRLEEEGLGSAWIAYWEPLFGSETTPAVLEDARQILFRQSVGDICRGVRALHSRADRSDVLRQWTKPVVIVEGDQDRPDRGLEMAKLAPMSRLELIPDTGHYVPLERPATMRRILEGALDWE